MTLTDEIIEYYFTMARRERLIIVTDLETKEVVSVASFFLLHTLKEVAHFHRHKTTWEAPDDYPEAPVMYIDQLQGALWTLAIRREFQRQIEERFPCVTLAVWYRQQGTKDRRVLVWRKGVSDARHRPAV